MNVSEILEGLNANESRLLLALASKGRPTSPEEIFSAGAFDQLVEVMNAASWLNAKGLITLSETSFKCYSLKKPLDAPLPERRALDYILNHGGQIEMSDLSKAVDASEVSIALGWLRKKNLASVDKSSGKTMIVVTEEGKLQTETDDEKVLRILSNGEAHDADLDSKAVAQLKSRQDLITERIVTDRILTLTDLGKEVINSGLEVKEEVAQLTPELIQSGKWKDVAIRKYDVRTFAPAIYPGKKHPLSIIADEIRTIFTSMGFKEIDEQYVQPAFWNMDALFTPQDHPARELQDTFYLAHPQRADIDDPVVEKVAAIHENGGSTGSTGWGTKWSKEEAERLLLRTHTTVNSIKHLSKHTEPPVKVFSLSKVFRKEAIDATHLPEFTQIEGIIMDKDANFDMLCGIIKEFYRRMGFKDIRFRPGYFPYVEPSLEVEVKFRGKWMELGGAGVFRPEVTEPFGIKYPVLAWGMGFERLAMLRWNLKDLRDLYISDIEMLRENPLI